MANKKYTELPQANAITGAEILAMVQDGVSVQGNIDLIKAYFDTLYAPTLGTIVARTSYTPTFTGFGTVSNVVAYYSQLNGYLYYDVRWTCGTSTAVEARVSIPVAASANYGGLSVSGQSSNNSDTNNTITLIEPSVAYVTFGRIYVTSVAGLAKQNASAFSSTGNIMSITGRVMI